MRTVNNSIDYTAFNRQKALQEQKRINPYAANRATAVKEREDVSEPQKKDIIAVSKEATYAASRAKLGLKPRGRLTKKDLLGVTDEDTTTVQSTLKNTAQLLGVGADQSLSLTRDVKGKILITEEFPQREALEKILNEDQSFTSSFNRLASNSEILNYAENMSFVSNKLSFISILNGEIDGNSSMETLEKLADQYNALKTSKDPLSIISSISREAAPFTFTLETLKEEGLSI